MKMSLDKSIQSGKEHRKPYRGAKAIDAAGTMGVANGAMETGHTRTINGNWRQNRS